MADPCVQLAQRLAGNEKKIRDRALRRLRTYLRERSREGGFSEEDFGKIWKGLFYCLWMQDKPLLQEELARNMAHLVHVLHSRQSRDLFLRVFWRTLNREWSGIDRLRLDKFYTLMRFVFHQSGQLVKQANWEESMVEEFLAVLVEEVLKAEAPRGVQHHLIDIYLEELGKIGAAQLTADMNLKLIDPFCKIAAKTKDSLLQQSVVSGIFQIIVDQAPYAIEDLMKEIGHNPPEGETEGGAGSGSGGSPALDVEDIGPVLQFDYQAISERLFALASRQNIPTRNRKSLYGLVKRFKDLAEGIFPQDDFPEEVSTDEDDEEEFSSWRFRQRQKKFQQRLMLETQGFITEPEKRKCREGASSPGHPPEELEKAEGPPAKRKRKKKVARPERVTDHLKINGKAESPPPQRKIKHKDNSAHEEPRAAQLHCSDTDGISSAKARVKRRRSRLLRLSLSVLPLRGALLMRRRRALGKSRMIRNKADPPPAAPPVSPVAPPVSPNGRPVKVASARQDFVAFSKSEAPKPLYVKSSKSGGRQIHKDQNCNYKKVTFSLNKNMTAEFKRTDRSLLVSPAGSSRVPFNPDQRPPHGVLKTPSPASRARASDFF